MRVTAMLECTVHGNIRCMVMYNMLRRCVVEFLGGPHAWGTRTFSAHKGGGAFCNGHPIHTSSTSEITRALLVRPLGCRGFRISRIWDAYDYAVRNCIQIISFSHAHQLDTALLFLSPSVIITHVHGAKKQHVVQRRTTCAGAMWCWY